MTASYTVGNGFSGAIKYCVNKSEAVIIGASNIVFDVSEKGIAINIPNISKQMRTQAQERPRVKKPVLHLSFSFNYSEKISEENQLKAVKKGLVNVGIDINTCQSIMVKHNDTKNPHYHLVINRVDLKGDLHNDNRLMDRLQVSCDQVEQEMNLQPTEGRTVIYDPLSQKGYTYLKKKKKKKKAIVIKKNPKKAPFEKIILDFYENAKKHSVDIESFKKIGLKGNIDIDIKTNKNGIYGISFKDIATNVAVKGSVIGIKVKELNQILPHNKFLQEEEEEEKKKRKEATVIKPKLIVPILDKSQRVALAIQFHLQENYKGKINNISLYNQASPLILAIKSKYGYKLTIEELKEVHTKVSALSKGKSNIKKRR